MPVQRLEHVGIVVEDLGAAISFFRTIGLEVEGEASVEGAWVDRVIGLEDVRVDIVMLRTPDGQGLEVSRFRSPVSQPAAGNAPNVRGLRHVAFLVDDVEATVAELREQGFGLVGELERFENEYLLCYVRGPEGILVELAQQLS